MSTNSSNSKDPLTILNTVFNHQSFRSRQEEIIENVLAGRNTLAILPTGAGKSLCFQIPALIFDGLTVVVSPLIALMKDQVDNLKKKGVLDVAYINSMLDQSTKERIYEQLKESKLKMLYVAPETFVDNKLMNILKSCNISLIAIDEVHCISIWGHNFRPDYLRLRRVIKALNNLPPPVLGLTATATKTVEEDIQVQLGVKCDAFNASFDRKNLLFSVLKLKSNVRKEEILKGLLERLKGSTIVYVNFTKTAEELSGYLSNEGLSASFYHGQMEKEERKKVQNDFMCGETRIVVATSAFGMGIDKEDIRGIIHFNLPKSVEDYYQEVGRAGRDGNISNCILLYSESDEIKLRKLIRYNTPSRKQIKAVLDFLTNRVGGGSGLIYVNVKRLAYDLGLDEVPVRLMLHHLEEKEAIKTQFKIFRRAKIRLNDTDLDDREEVERIVRSGYFVENKWLDLEALSAALGISISKLNWIFRDLGAAGKIELAEGDVCIPVQIKPVIRGIDVKEIQDIFLELERSGLKKIDRVVECVNSEECRRKFILNYFGEDYTQPCNACDVCNPFLKLEEGIKAREMEFVGKEVIGELKNLRIAHGDDAEMIVLKSVVLLNGIRYSWLISVLLGYDYLSIRSEGLDKVECYGMLKGKLSKGELGGLIDRMVIDGLLLKTIDTELFIAKKGIESIKEIVTPRQDFVCASAIYKEEGGDITGKSDKSTEIAFVIFKMIKDLDFHPGRTFLADVLIGSKSKRIINQNLQESSYYSVLKDYTADEVKGIIDQLIGGGYLEKRQGNSRYPRPVLHLTDKAERMLKENERVELMLPVKEEGVIARGKSLKVFEELKKWRREVASEKNIPPYCVFQDSTLIRIANKLPKTKKELEGIKGVGRKRIEAYSGDILGITKALEKIGSEDAIPHLKRLLNDEKPYVREAATAALKRTKVRFEEKSMRAEEELFEKLKRLREDIWREDNLHPSMFPASTLREIAAKMPTTKEELMLIKWIGPEKVEKYGERILSVIRAHLSEKSKA